MAVHELRYETRRRCLVGALQNQEVASVMRTKTGLRALLIVAFVSVSCAGTKDLGAGLWGLLGSGSGVSALANSFASSLSKNAAATKALGADGIESAKNGLYNTIAKTGGYKIDKGSDLLSVLKGKKLDDAAVADVGASLMAAGQDQKLSPSAMDALSKMWQPIGKSL